jgi:hypothetical protein
VAFPAANRLEQADTASLDAAEFERLAALLRFPQWAESARLHSGADPTELLQQGAGTRPGAKTPRALTWKTL